MSLIIAKKVGNDIFLISDTKLTDEGNHQLNHNIEDNRLKITILTPQIVFAFAGKEDNANEALKRIHKIPKVEDIISSLLEYHINSIDSQGSSDFILALGKPHYEIIEFKNGTKRSTPSSWIGSQQGFNQFQKLLRADQTEFISEIGTNTDPNFTEYIYDVHFAIAPTNKERNNFEFCDVYFEALKVMKYIITSNQIREIGGVCIPVAYHQGEFEYMKYTDSYYGKEIIPFVPNTPVTIVPLIGTSKLGSYYVDIITGKSQQNERYLACYFLFGKYGVIYKRENGGLPKPITPIFKGSPIDFAFKIANEFSLLTPPSLAIGFRIDDFRSNALQYFDLSQFSKAISRLDFGIKLLKNDPNLKLLIIFKADILMQQKNYREASENYLEVLPLCDDQEKNHVFYKISLALNYLNENKLALEYSERLIQLNPQHLDAYYAAAFSCFKILAAEINKDHFQLASKAILRAKEKNSNPDKISLLEKDMTTIQTLIF